MPRLRADEVRRPEVERHRAEYAGRGAERERDECAKAKFGRDLLPVLERRVGGHVEHLDHAALARCFAAGTEPQPDAHLSKEA